MTSFHIPERCRSVLLHLDRFGGAVDSGNRRRSKSDSIDGVDSILPTITEWCGVRWRGSFPTRQSKKAWPAPFLDSCISSINSLLLALSPFLDLHLVVSDDTLSEYRQPEWCVSDQTDLPANDSFTSHAKIQLLGQLKAAAAVEH